MPWWGWLLLALGAAWALTAAVLLLLVWSGRDRSGRSGRPPGGGDETPGASGLDSPR